MFRRILLSTIILLISVVSIVWGFQAPYIVPNTSSPTFRTNLNNALSAVGTFSAGTSAPSSPVANQAWLNTTTNPPVLYIRDPTNSTWVNFGNTISVGGNISLTTNITGNGYTGNNFGTATSSGQPMIYGANTLNQLATATGNYSMGTHTLTNMLTAAASGQPMIYGNNSLDQLAQAAGNYSMNNHLITGLAPPVADGEVLSIQAPTVTTISTSTATINCNTSDNQQAIITTNTTLTISIPANGQRCIVDATENSTGGFTIAFSGGSDTLVWNTGTAPTFITTANTHNVVSFFLNGSTIVGSFVGAGGSGAGPINTLPSQTANYNANNYSLTNIATVTPNTNQIAQHNLGSPTGAQFTNEGEYNVNDSIWGGSCATGSIGSATPEVCIQAAYEAACNAGQKFGSTPWVHIPRGTYTLGNNGLVWDCPNLTHVFGDGEYATTLVASGNFPVMQAIAPQTQTDLGSLTAANIATGGTANTAHNWAHGSASYGDYFYDLKSVLFKHYGIQPLNGLSGIGIAFYFSSPIADSNEHVILSSASSHIYPNTSPVSNNFYQSLDLRFTSTTLTAGVNTGTGDLPPSEPTKTIAANTNYYVEFDYDNATGYEALYVCAPGSSCSTTATHAYSGNIQQYAEEFMAFGGLEDGTLLDGSNYMQGVIDSLKIDSAALHTCPSGTCATFTAPTAKLTTDANTMLLDPGTSSGGATFTTAKWAWPVNYTGGASNSQMVPLVNGQSGADQAQGIDVRNLGLEQGNYNLLNQNHFESIYKNLFLLPNYAGIWLHDNAYNGHLTDVFMDLADAGTNGAAGYGWVDDENSQAYGTGLRLSGGGNFPFDGHSPEQYAEIDPNSDTVLAIINDWGGTWRDSLFDSENSYIGPAIALFESGPQLVVDNMDLVSNTNVPNIYQGESVFNDIYLSNLQLLGSGGTSPFIALTEQFSQYPQVFGIGVGTANTHLPISVTQMCGSSLAYNCFNFGSNSYGKFAGTPGTLGAVPTCSSTLGPTTFCVSDSTACTNGTTYTSGSTTPCNVYCNGTSWIEAGSGC